MLCFVIDGDEQVSGTGDVVATIEAPRFELFRAVSGRRAAAEIEQYKWDRDPDPELLLASEIFSLRDLSCTRNEKVGPRSPSGPLR